MTTSLTDILAAIPALTPDEQDQVAAAIKAAQALGANTKTKGKTHAPSRADMPADARDVLMAICGHLNRYGLDPTTLPMATTMAEYRSVVLPVAEQIMEQIRDMMPVEVHRRALLALGVKLVVRDLQEFTKPTVKNVMKRAAMIPGAIQKEFPGYAAAGLLPILFQTRDERNG